MANFAEVLRQQVVKACTELFRHYKGSVRLVNEKKVTKSETKGVVGMISFYGPMVRGSFHLILNEEILNKIGSSEMPKNDDWAAELSNQLLGRIKNLLRKYDVALYVSTPMGLTGNNLNFSFRSEITVCYDFELMTPDLNTTFSLVVDAKYDENWQVELNLADEGMSEGDTVLF